jgi:hypothetical protein
MWCLLADRAALVQEVRPELCQPPAPPTPMAWETWTRCSSGSRVCGTIFGVRRIRIALCATSSAGGEYANPSSRIGVVFDATPVADQRVTRKGLHYSG